VKQVLATEKVHLLKLGHELPEELGRFIREKLDAFDQVYEDLLSDFAFKCDRQFF